MEKTVYSAKSPLTRPGRLIRESITGIWNARELAWILFMRDIKAQYRESYLGYVWLIAPPLTTMMIWVFLNSQKIIQIQTEVPYPLFVLIGTTVWTSFTGTIQKPLQSFNGGKSVFMKLRVPPEAYIFSGFYRAVFELLIRLLLIVPLFLLFRFVPPLSALLFPVALFMVLTMGLALGLTLIPIGGFFGDVSNAITTFMGLLMFTVPVVFPIPEGEGLLATVMRWNPLTPGVSLCREVLVEGTSVWFLPAFAWCALSLLVIFISFLVIRVAMPHLVARMGM